VEEEGRRGSTGTVLADDLRLVGEPDSLIGNVVGATGEGSAYLDHRTSAGDVSVIEIADDVRGAGGG
jgi:hypothetical protein